MPILLLFTDRYELRFKTAKPNFEAPMDANKDNMYKVTVVAEDLAGLTGKMSLVIMVGNMNEKGSVELSSESARSWEAGHGHPEGSGHRPDRSEVAVV